MAKQLIQELLDINAQQANHYFEQEAMRRAYREAHPTLVIAFKCMDGRIHLPVITKTPFGLIRPKRNIGGIFRMGWPTERARLSQLMDYAWSNRRRCLFFVTYHFSKSDPHLGCAGQKYDTEAAKRTAADLVKELLFAYRGGIQENYAIMVGVETDEDTLIFHGHNGLAVSMAEVEDTGESHLMKLIRQLYPDMREEIARDLIPLMRGNVERIHELRTTPKSNAELAHHERVIAVGQGFDWLHRINYALIINDGDPKLADSIGVAAGIIKKSRDLKRVPESGAVYLVSVPYYRGYERNQAILHAQYLAELGRETIKADHPDAADFFKPLTCVMHWDTRKLEVLE